MTTIFELCPNERCELGKIWHFGKYDIFTRECPDCGGTGQVVIEDKEKEAMLEFILSIAYEPMPVLLEGTELKAREMIMKAQRFLKQLPNTYLKEEK